jgi:hypothetical protein
MGEFGTEWILENRVSGCGLDLSGSGYEPVKGSCKTVINLQIP